MPPVCQLGTAYAPSSCSFRALNYDLSLRVERPRYRVACFSFSHTATQVFTQEGVAMLSSVLRSPRAVQVNITIMRVFVRLRDTLALHKDLAHKLSMYCAFR
jgi:hypothetical protein